jgi:hypothetical protein
VLSWFETRKKEMPNRPLIREQAFGEAREERMLAMLPAPQGPAAGAIEG